MFDKAQLCEKLHEIYPEIGECDIDLNVNWDAGKNAWAVDFSKNGNKIRHYLENEDADLCLDREQCLNLGIEFGQFL